MITRMSSINVSSRLSSFVKLTFVTFSLRNNSIIIFKPARDLLNIVVVKSAIASESLVPCTCLPIASSLKNILIKISPIMSSFSWMTPKTLDLVELCYIYYRILTRNLLMLSSMTGIIFLRLSWLKLGPMIAL